MKYYHERKKQRSMDHSDKYEARLYDKSTAYNGSTEEPEHHPDFYDNVPHDYLPAVKAFSVILLAGIAIMSVKYNTWKPSWEELDWTILKCSSVLFAFLWSGILAVECLFIIRKRWLRWLGVGFFTGLFMVLAIQIVMWVIFKLTT